MNRAIFITPATSLFSSTKTLTMNTKPTYDDYIEYMESIGWKREHTFITEKDSIVSFPNYWDNPYNNPCVDIRCPDNQRYTIRGKELGNDFVYAYIFELKFADKNDIEINPDTKIRIYKDWVTSDLCNVIKLKYSECQFGKSYKFPKIFGFDGLYNHLVIHTIGSNLLVDKEHIKFSLEVDKWSKKVSKWKN